MNVHKNASMTPKGREKMVRAVVDEGLSPVVVAGRFRTTPKTVRKWVARYRAEGEGGLRDRSSRPHFLPSKTPGATCAVVEWLRWERYTMDRIADETGLSRATVSRILEPRGLSRLDCLEPKPERPRYEREKPGEIIHIDIKKLGRFNKPGHRATGDRSSRHRTRGAGWDYVHVAIDDHSRVAYSAIFPNEKKESAVAHLEAVAAWFRSLGVNVQRVMTDNGSCYRSRKFREACEKLKIKHIRTKPFTPQTNGKAERFVQTTIREWAYANQYQTSEERKKDLPKWLHGYNWHRPHASLGNKPPISRLGLNGDNLLRLHN